MPINHRDNQKKKTRNEEIVADLFRNAGAVPPSPPETVIKRKAAEISALMALVHGGDWRAQIDHEDGLIVIARRRDRKQSP